MITSEENIRCQCCDADNLRHREKCWLCHEYLRKAPATTLAKREPSIASTKDSASFQFSLASILLTTTLLATIFAVVATAPGLGILLAIVSMPPLVRTMIVVQRRQERGLEVNSEEKVGLFIASLTVTIVVSAVALFLSLSTFCGAFLVTTSNTGIGVPTGLLTLVISAVLIILAIWFFWKWIRRRWQRDVNRP
jgi:hypothetical protein